MQQLSMFSSEELPAPTTPSLEAERAWLAKLETSQSNSLELLDALGLVGLSGRTCQVFCRPTVVLTSSTSSESWKTSGFVVRGEYWTFNTSEHPNLVIESSLSDILEPPGSPHLSRYYLSPKASAGILRRARARRGKELPAVLLRALESVARKIQSSTAIQ